MKNKIIIKRINKEVLTIPFGRNLFPSLHKIEKITVHIHTYIKEPYYYVGADVGGGNSVVDFMINGDEDVKFDCNLEKYTLIGNSNDVFNRHFYEYVLKEIEK